MREKERNGGREEGREGGSERGRERREGGIEGVRERAGGGIMVGEGVGVSVREGRVRESGEVERREVIGGG